VRPVDAEGVVTRRPRLTPLPEGEAQCIHCRCMQTDAMPFIHNGNCPTVESRPTFDTVGAKHAVALWRAMTGGAA
jgi:hypothetical protein